MKGYLAFGKQSTPGAATAPTKFWPVVTPESVCTCGHAHGQHGYIDGFWDNTPDSEPCDECSCADFTLSHAS